MKKVILVLALLSANIQASPELSQVELDDIKKTLHAQGFNVYGSVTIVPKSSIKASHELKMQWKSQDLEQKEKGYYVKEAPRAKELLQLHETIDFIYRASAKNTSTTSSNLRRFISEIKMGYVFTPVQQSETVNVLGFAPSGGYNDGWNGIVEFFDKKGLGSCAYSESNLKLSHGTEKIDEDKVRYDINGKVTTVDIYGTPKTGYLYTVHWADDNYFRDLECANLSYSIEITNAVITLAKQIDEL